MPPRSVDEWLESIKYGYGRRYVSFFDELGVEDEDDLRRMKDARVEELRRLLERSGIKPVQMDYLTDAVDEVRGAGRGWGDAEARPAAEGFATEGFAAEPRERPRSASGGREAYGAPPDAARPASPQRPQSASAARRKPRRDAAPDYAVEDRALVERGRPRSAPASKPGSFARSLVLPQPPSAGGYWAQPAPADLPVTLVSPEPRRARSPKREAPGYESLRRRQVTETLGRRRREQHATASWEEEDADRATRDAAARATCRVRRDGSGVWRLDIDPSRQLVYKRISAPVRVDGDHKAAIKVQREHAEEMRKVFSHRVKVNRDKDGLWAMNLKKPETKEMDADRVETWRRVTQPFRLKGVHVQSIAEISAEDREKEAAKKHFYYASKESQEWCARMAQPLRAAEKFSNFSPRGIN